MFLMTRYLYTVQIHDFGTPLTIYDGIHGQRPALLQSTNNFISNFVIALRLVVNIYIFNNIESTLLDFLTWCTIFCCYHTNVG